MFDALYLVFAWFLALVAMGWLALSLDTHWRQVVGQKNTRKRSNGIILRLLASLALVLSLGLCLAADHATMAALVWVMILAASAMLISMTLTWRGSWLIILLGRSPLRHDGLP